MKSVTNQQVLNLAYKLPGDGIVVPIYIGVEKDHTVKCLCNVGTKLVL
jgi:hypothetical protein